MYHVDQVSRLIDQRLDAYNAHVTMNGLDRLENVGRNGPTRGRGRGFGGR